MSQTYLKMHNSDNVAVALQAFEPNHKAANVTLREPIPQGHKFALQDIALGQNILKYGQVIAVATRDIKAGQHVHDHNIGWQACERAVVAQAKNDQAAQQQASKTFMGYHRSNGKVGTRNYVGVMASVNCSATVVARIARHFERNSDLLPPNVDGVIPITHQSGCGMSGGDAEGYTLLQRVLRGYLNHVNFYGWLVVGLGCEVNQLSSLLAEERATVMSLDIQNSGGTSFSVEQGIAKVEALIAEAAQCERQAAPASQLTLGLQCGGSDGFSGITANPVLGAAADCLVAQGGTAILAETPEIYGAEQLLMARATNEVQQKLQARLDWWQDYLAKNNQHMNNNPSPGNLAGGISTILEKSLGAVVKGGSSPLNDVILYAEPAQQRGFLFMDSPGYDPCSVTGEVAAGANLIAFTTGRGSTFGATGAPTIKLASNQAMYQRMNDDMDVDCSAVLRGEHSIASLGEHVFEQLLAIASGEQTSSERLGLGDYEFVPWHIGAVV